MNIQTVRNTLVRRITGAAAFAAAAVILTGCATGGEVEPPAEASEAADFGHVHGLGVDPQRGTVFAATHFGVWELPAIDSEPVSVEDLSGPIAGRAHDFMGFTMEDQTMLASGHPDPSEELGVANMGLIVSYDRAETWEPVALWGETDFHDLTAFREPTANLRIYGLDSASGAVKASLDAGQTWSEGARLVARDLASDPSTVGAVYATTEDGLSLSTDDGATFAVIPDAPMLYLVETALVDDQLLIAGIDTEGAIWVKEPGTEWRTTGTVEGAPQAMVIAVTPEPVMVIADDRGIVVSDDFGSTARILVTPRN